MAKMMTCQYCGQSDPYKPFRGARCVKCYAVYQHERRDKHGAEELSMAQKMLSKPWKGAVFD